MQNSYSAKYIILVSSLVCSWAGQFDSLVNDNYLIFVAFVIASYVISSNIFKFSGENVKRGVIKRKLPIIEFTGKILNKQSFSEKLCRTDFFIFIFNASYSISMSIVFIFFREDVLGLLLFLGCITFSGLFSVYLLNTSVEKNTTNIN